MLTSFSKFPIQASPVDPTRSYRTYSKQALKKVRQTLPSLEVIITFLTLDEILNLFSLNTNLWLGRNRYPLAFSEKPYFVYIANSKLDTSDGLQASSVWLKVETNHFQLGPHLSSRLRYLKLTNGTCHSDISYGVRHLEEGLPGLEGLRECNNLVKLELIGLSFKRLDTLAGWTKLEELKLSETRLPRSVLPVLPALKSVWLSDAVTGKDFSFLKECLELEQLRLADCHQITTLAGVSALTKLRHLTINPKSLSRKRKLSLDELLACPKLETLKVGSFTVDDSFSLNSLTRLQKLTISLSTDSNLAFMRCCRNLTKLCLDWCTSLAGLEYGTQLKSIKLYNIGSLDLTPLQACTNLTSIKLVTTMPAAPDFTLEGVVNLTKLEQFHLEVDGSLKDANYLQGCHNLRSFYFSGDQIETSHLANFPLLEQIELFLTEGVDNQLTVTPRLKQLSIRSKRHFELRAGAGTLFFGET